MRRWAHRLLRFTVPRSKAPSKEAVLRCCTMRQYSNSINYVSGTGRFTNQKVMATRRPAVKCHHLEVTWLKTTLSGGGMKKNEKLRCTNPLCQKEIFVSSVLVNTRNLRCECGSVMKREYEKPILRKVMATRGKSN